MARVTYVKKAQGRKDGRQRSCTKCHKEIKPGEPYKWFVNRIGRTSMRKNFCATCAIRPSDQTTSPHLQTMYLAQESAQDVLGSSDGLTLADIAEVVRSYAEGVREAGEGYGESADNMEDGFGHETQLSEEIREKASACESAADEIDSLADDIEALDDPDAEESEFASEFEGETDEDDEPVDADEWAEFIEAKREERRDAAIQAAEDALNEEPQF